LNTLCFLSGLPRSGGTWLSSILNQNPDFYVTPQSPFVEILWRNYTIWNDVYSDENIASDKMKDIKTSYLQKITQSFYSELTDCSIIIDRRPAWHNLNNIKMYEDIFGKLPKIICPVRNVDEIAASFVSLFRNNGRNWHSDDMKDVLFQNYINLKNTFNSKYVKCILFVDYKNLVEDTSAELERIYKFIGAPSYAHQLDSVSVDKSYKKVEEIFGLKNMHRVKEGIYKSKIVPENYLEEEELKFYRDLTFWDTTL